MKSTNVTLLWFPFVLYFSIVAANGEDISLPVLVLLPFPDSRNDSGWERGLDLLPAARVAVREVNNQTDLLPGYKLELIEASSDACGLSLTTTSLSNFILNSLNRRSIAVVGLACSSVTASISPIAGQPVIDLLQISMSNSPIFRNRTQFRRLWRIIPSSIAYINATLSILEHFNASGVSTIYDTLRVDFQTTAEFFRSAVKMRKSTVYQILHIGIELSDTSIDDALTLIQSKAARIIYVIGTLQETSRLMCKAGARNIIWPGYMWIFQEKLPSDIIRYRTCSIDVITRALENMMFINYKLNDRSPEDILVSGKTYSQYHNEYLKELREIQTEPFVQPYLSEGYKFEASKYSNPMYDEVWALALALNSSLRDLEYHNLSLKHYQYNVSNVTDIIEKHLKSVKFAGAVNDISFNSDRESQVSIDIIQVLNSTGVYVGFYSGVTNTLTIYNSSKINLPNENFEVRYNLLGTGFTIFVLTTNGICVLFTTLILVLMITFYNEPEVKATSPLLSLLIFVGAYFNYAASALLIVQQHWLVSDRTYEGLCSASHMISTVGLGFVIATVLIKLARVYRVFTHFGRTGKAWHDRYLFIYIVLIGCLLPVVLNTVFFIASPLRYGTTVRYFTEANPPFQLISIICETDFLFLWSAVDVSYYLILMISIVFFAFSTRKVDRKNFKDTKKTIVFIFILVMVGGLLLFPSLVLKNLAEENLAVVLLSITTQITPMTGIVLLISTKVFSVLFRRVGVLRTLSKQFSDYHSFHNFKLHLHSDKYRN